MALKFMLKSLDELDDAQRSLYVKHEDGNFYLDVDGAVAKQKVDEFRNNNIDLKKQVEEYESKFKDIDPAKYSEMLAEIERLSNDDNKNKNQGPSKEEIENIVAERTKAMKQDYENQVQALKNANETQAGQLNGLLIDSAVRSAATEAGVRKGALSDVVLRAQQSFKVVDGNAVAHDENGGIIYGKNGTDPLSVHEWVSGLKTSAEHLFEANSGGGAGGSDNRNNNSSNRADPANMTALQKIQAGMSSGE